MTFARCSFCEKPASETRCAAFHANSRKPGAHSTNPGRPTTRWTIGGHNPEETRRIPTTPAPDWTPRLGSFAGTDRPICLSLVCWPCRGRPFEPLAGLAPGCAANRCAISALSEPAMIERALPSDAFGPATRSWAPRSRACLRKLSRLGQLGQTRGDQSRLSPRARGDVARGRAGVRSHEIDHTPWVFPCLGATGAEPQPMWLGSVPHRAGTSRAGFRGDRVWWFPLFID
jgi:hypothetical protein